MVLLNCLDCKPFCSICTFENCEIVRFFLFFFFLHKVVLQFGYIYALLKVWI